MLTKTQLKFTIVLHLLAYLEILVKMFFTSVHIYLLPFSFLFMKNVLWSKLTFLIYTKCSQIFGISLSFCSTLSNVGRRRRCCCWWGCCARGCCCWCRFDIDDNDHCYHINITNIATISSNISNITNISTITIISISLLLQYFPFITQPISTPYPP